MHSIKDSLKILIFRMRSCSVKGVSFAASSLMLIILKVTCYLQFFKKYSYEGLVNGNLVQMKEYLVIWRKNMEKIEEMTALDSVY